MDPWDLESEHQGSLQLEESLTPPPEKSAKGRPAMSKNYPEDHSAQKGSKPKGRPLGSSRSKRSVFSNTEPSLEYCDPAGPQDYGTIFTQHTVMNPPPPVPGSHTIPSSPASPSGIGFETGGSMVAKPKQTQVHLRDVLAAVAERARAEEDSQFVDSQPVADDFPSPHIDQSNTEPRDSLVILDEKGKKRVEKEQRREKGRIERENDSTEVAKQHHEEQQRRGTRKKGRPSRLSDSQRRNNIRASNRASEYKRRDGEKVARRDLQELVRTSKGFQPKNEHDTLRGAAEYIRSLLRDAEDFQRERKDLAKKHPNF